MRTENLDARSNSAFESFPNVGDSTSIRPSATDRGLDSLYVRLQLNMGDHQYIKRSSSHHTLANISVEHHLPYRTLATASPNLHTCTTPDLTSGYSSVSTFSPRLCSIPLLMSETVRSFQLFPLRLLTHASLRHRFSFLVGRVLS